MTIHSGTKSLGKEKFIPHDTLLFEGLFGEGPKSIPSIYFYDEEGTKLFRQISELPEYYLKSKELDIIRYNASNLAKRVTRGEPTRVIELGAGSSEKSVPILKALTSLTAEVEYVPIDISTTALANITPEILSLCPSVTATAVVGDNLSVIQSLDSNDRVRNLVLFLGSSLGNLDQVQSERFLLSVSAELQSGDFILIGFDLLKDIEIMQKAYSDESGVTREFNLNLLRRMNRELGSDFNVSRFYHHAFFNPRNGCMESHLISHIDQTVNFSHWRNSLTLSEFESIHTEISQKYSLADIHRLGAVAGLDVEELWTDEDLWFCDALFKVR